MVQPGVRINSAFIYCIFFILLNCFWACHSNDKQLETQNTNPEPVINVPLFNPDSAYSYTKVQVDFGPRTPNSVAHSKCGDYLVTKLKQYCDTVIEQKAPIASYDGKTLQMRNIIGSFNPSKANRILLAAHWDTRPWADQDSVGKDKPIDGANDGAAPVATLLEVARQLSLANYDAGIDIIFFDMEDYGKSEFENSFCYFKVV